MSSNQERQTVTPYLILKNSNQFLEFTQKVFGASIKEKHLTDSGDIMHAHITIGNSSIMIGGAGGNWAPQPAGLFIYVDNADLSYKVALENGSTSLMPPADQEYGRSCGVKDAFGNTWWITSDLKK